MALTTRKTEKPASDSFTDALTEANALINTASAYRASVVAAEAARKNAQAAASSFAATA